MQLCDGEGWHKFVNLHILDKGTLMTETYLDDILQEYVVPFETFILNIPFLILHDNARQQALAVVHLYLEEVRIHFLLVPEKNPDFNIIEHVLDMLRRHCKPPEHVLSRGETTFLKTPSSG